MLRWFRRAAVIVAAVLAVMMIHVGEPAALWWWGMALPFAAWVIGAAVAPYALARRSGDAAVVTALLVLFMVSNVAGLVSYFRAFFLSESSTAALVLIFVPLWQWCACLLAALGCALASRIRNARRRMNMHA